MKNKKSAGFKMKKSAAKMFGMAALAGQRIGQRMMNPNYTPPTQTDQGPIGQATEMFDPSQLSEAQKAQQEALRAQMRQYKFNLMGGMGDYSDAAAASLQKAYASKDPRMKAVLEARRKKYGSRIRNPKTQNISFKNPYLGIIGGGPRRFSGGVSQVGNMVAQLAPFTMKRGSKPNQSEFFKGKK